LKASTEPGLDGDQAFTPQLGTDDLDGMTVRLANAQTVRAVAPIDGNTSWLYLPHPAHARQLAGCSVLTVD
jgi:hypothetical protein